MNWRAAHGAAIVRPGRSIRPDSIVLRPPRVTACLNSMTPVSISILPNALVFPSTLAASVCTAPTSLSCVNSSAPPASRSNYLSLDESRCAAAPAAVNRAALNPRSRRSLVCLGCIFLPLMILAVLSGWTAARRWVYSTARNSAINSFRGGPAGNFAGSGILEIGIFPIGFSRILRVSFAPISWYR